MTALWRALASTRLTVGLIVGLAVLLALGLVVPQEGVLTGERLDEWRRAHPVIVPALQRVGLTSIHGSVPAMVLWAAFFVNLVAGMLQRIPVVLRRVGRVADASGPGLGGGGRRRLSIGGEAALDRAAAFFRGRGFAVVAGEHGFAAVRNRFSPLATLLFHSSFLVILAGGVTSVMTRFEAEVELGEGQRFDASPGRYVTQPRVGRFSRWPTAGFRVVGIDQQVVGNQATGVQVAIEDGAGRTRRLEINRPYVSEDGTSFVFRNLGFAPFLVATKADGEVVWRGVVKLNVLAGRADEMTLLGRKVNVDLFPDWYLEGGRDATRSMELRNPVIRLSFDRPGGATLSARMAPGQAVEFGSYTVHFVDWAYWVRLYARSERGIWAIFSGLALAAGALGWRLILYRRDYVIALADGGGALEISGRADYYRDLFLEEFDATVDALAARLPQDAADARERMAP